MCSCWKRNYATSKDITRTSFNKDMPFWTRLTPTLQMREWYHSVWMLSMQCGTNCRNSSVRERPRWQTSLMLAHSSMTRWRRWLSGCHTLPTQSMRWRHRRQQNNTNNSRYLFTIDVVWSVSTVRNHWVIWVYGIPSLCCWFRLEKRFRTRPVKSQ